MSPSDPQTVLCSLSQSGGIAGTIETLIVMQSGEVTLTRDRPTAHTIVGHTSKEQLAALRTAVESDAWQQLPSEIGEAVPDGFTYEVHCGNKTVTTYDGVDHPSALSAVLEQLHALRQAAANQ